MLEYYKYFLTYFFMWFLWKPKVWAEEPTEELLSEDFEEIKVRAERRKTEAVRLREEWEKEQAEADLLARVAASVQWDVWGIIDQKKSLLQEVQIDEFTQIIIPEGLRLTSSFQEALRGGWDSISVKNFTEAMILAFGQINVQIRYWENTITTQMYHKIIINWVETTLRDFILSPHRWILQEMQS